MKKLLLVVLSLVVSLVAINAYAFTPPAKPDNGWYVLDQAGKLSTDEKDRLNHKIDDLNKSTKNEYAVLILNSLDGDNIEDAAQESFRAWGVGKAGLDNGIMIVISVGDRKTRLQTGKGAEGDLPDLLCKDILDNQLKPFLKQGKYYEGLDATVSAVSSHMESRDKASPAPVSAPVSAPVTKPAESNGVSFLATVLLIMGILFFVGIAFLLLKERAHSLKFKREMDSLDAQNELAKARARDNARAMRMHEERHAQLSMDREAKIFSSYRKVENFVPTVKTHTKTTPVNKNTAIAVAKGVGATAAATAGLSVVSKSIEEDRRKRAEREEEDRKKRHKKSHSDSSSSYDSGSSSSSSSWSDSGSFGGGFGGGDSGGGGSSGDF